MLLNVHVPRGKSRVKVEALMPSRDMQERHRDRIREARAAHAAVEDPAAAARQELEDVLHDDTVSGADKLRLVKAARRKIAQAKADNEFWRAHPDLAARIGGGKR